MGGIKFKYSCQESSQVKIQQCLTWATSSASLKWINPIKIRKNRENKSEEFWIGPDIGICNLKSEFVFQNVRPWGWSTSLLSEATTFFLKGGQRWLREIYFENWRENETKILKWTRNIRMFCHRKILIVVTIIHKVSSVIIWILESITSWRINSKYGYF